MLQAQLRVPVSHRDHYLDLVERFANDGVQLKVTFYVPREQRTVDAKPYFHGIGLSGGMGQINRMLTEGYTHLRFEYLTRGGTIDKVLMIRVQEGTVHVLVAASYQEGVETRRSCRCGIFEPELLLARIRSYSHQSRPFDTMWTIVTHGNPYIRTQQLKDALQHLGWDGKLPT